MKLYNTLTRSLEEFTPIDPPKVGLYTCGITAYDYSHIGHGRKYVGDDILRRTLTHFGYDVTHVQNITDVGHLVSDADDGEDKMQKGARKIGKTVWEVAEFFAEDFFQSMDTLGILRPTVVCKATDHIPEQIHLIERLISNGHAYDTEEAVYFDVASYSEYGKLFGQNLSDKQVAVRQEIQTGEHKRNPHDFALWFKRIGRFADHSMHWESPWGDGFPGWHIECSAMSMKYLGESFDIHTGGEDHIPIHHPNEIAQSEGATGKPFVHYWIHHSFLTVDNQKMSKSLGNVYRVTDVVEKGYDPLALRYFYLSAHYRKPINFTFEALTAAQNSLQELRKHCQAAKIHAETGERLQLSEEKTQQLDTFSASFDAAIGNDLNTAQALAVVWETAKSNIPAKDKYELLTSFDSVLGLDLFLEVIKTPIPQEILVLAEERHALRNQKQFEAADTVRLQIEALGFTVKDSTTGPVIEKLTTNLT